MNTAILAQNVVIVTLILCLGTSAARTSSSLPVPTLLAFYLLVAASLYALCYLTPLGLLKSLFTLSIPLSVLSKIPQIISNARSGSTGQLSAFLVFASLAGTAARVYTSKSFIDLNLAFVSLKAQRFCMFSFTRDRRHPAVLQLRLGRGSEQHSGCSARHVPQQHALCQPTGQERTHRAALCRSSATASCCAHTHAFAAISAPSRINPFKIDKYPAWIQSFSRRCSLDAYPIQAVGAKGGLDFPIPQT